MPYSLDPANVDLAFGSGTTSVGDRETTFSVFEVGRLHCATGAIGASDPFIDANPAPFIRRVPPGSHPVELAVAQLGNGDRRVAFARLTLAGRSTVAWEPALVPGQDAGKLGPEEYFGYGVDAGTGCFMDAAVAPPFDARMTAPDEWYMTLIDEMQANYVPTWSWLVVHPDPERQDNVIFFSSGWGDGAYPSFFGLDAEGEVTSLVTDFMILDGLPPNEAPPPPESDPDKKRHGRRFWERA